MIVKKKPSDDNSIKKQIYIVGSNNLQNELLFTHIKNEFDFKCFILETLNSQILLNRDTNKINLYILDCIDMQINSIWMEKRGLDKKATFKNCFFILFNIKSNQNIEKSAVDHGIHGIFYSNEPLKFFIKGIKAILDGQLWYSRDILSKYVIESRSPNNLLQKKNHTLTFREQEILYLIATGASNKEISDKLIISLHTVKTHIYNIYKKISVPNRLQATLWVTKNL